MTERTAPGRAGPVRTAPHEDIGTRVERLGATLRGRPLGRLLRSEAAMRLLAAIGGELAIERSGGNPAVLVTSTRRREGRSTAAVTLAGLAAASDPTARVLLIDADGGGAARLMGMAAGGPGLSDLLAGTADLADCARPTALANLWVLPPGAAAGAPWRVAHGSSAVFEAARADHDLTIVDGGPLSETDVLGLTRAVRNVVLVVRSAGPTRPDILAGIAELHRAGAVLLGSVLTRRRGQLRRALLSRGSERA